MSYCRFSECDVYAYDSSDGGVQFYVADGRGDLDRLCTTYNEAYQYAKTLRDTHGLDVPIHALEALKADALEEAALICGPDSAVAELEAENTALRTHLADATESMGRMGWRCAKLRELVCHLWYVKPRDVTSVLVEGKLVDLEELMESVGLRWEDA